MFLFKENLTLLGFNKFIPEFSVPWIEDGKGSFAL